MSVPRLLTPLALSLGLLVPGISLPGLPGAGGSGSALAQPSGDGANGDSKGPDLPVWHVQAVKQGRTGTAITYYWSKGRSLRALSVVGGHPVVTLVHGEWYHVFDQISGEGISVRRSDRALAQDRKGGRPFARELELLLEEGAERVGTEQYGGGRVDVYRLTTRRGRREVWAAGEESKLPVYVEVFNRRAMETETIRYLNWSRGLEIPERFFEPDPRMDLRKLTYAEYLEAAGDGPVGPVPVLYGSLLHGPRPDDES